MKFGPVPVRESFGALVAHGVQTEGLVLKKGDRISAHHIETLHRSGVETIVVARLEDGDIDENDAARHLAEAVTGPGLRIERAFTGRANIFACGNGVLEVDAGAVDRLNAVDERLTLATLPPFRAVEDGEMVGTVKIIPFAVSGLVLDAAIETLAAAAAAALRLAPYRPRRIGVVSTVLPGLKPSVIAKTLRVLADRLVPTGSIITADIQVPHDASALAQALRELVPSQDLLIVFGASAIADRRDVIPAAIEAAGGTVDHLGMPVDPGNLLLLGTLDGRPALGAPGCARSPKENGFDWVLQRLLADIPVTSADIRRLGAGGLLMEIVSRPQPRLGEAMAGTGRASRARGVSRVAAIVLAAGTASRYRAADPSLSTKLVALLDGKPLVRHVAEAALASRARPILVVTGHAERDVATALDGLGVDRVSNPDYATGLASSLRAGLAALPGDVTGALILLGDMPGVTSAMVDRLIGCFEADPTRDAVVPTHEGRRGNPALLARSLFASAATLQGDEGARRLLARARVHDVDLGDAAVALDIDDPAMLASASECPCLSDPP